MFGALQILLPLVPRPEAQAGTKQSTRVVLSGAASIVDKKGSNMPAIDLGVNSDSINYEVALEVLGQSRQPFMAAIREEQAKVTPSQPFIRYCEARLRAIDDLQDELEPSDHDTVDRILLPMDQPSLFRTGFGADHTQAFMPW
jgi:hypothetical protein